MATISFRPIGKKEVQNIYVRFSIDRQTNFRKNTGYSIKAKYWSKATNNIIKSKDAKVKKELEELKNHLDIFQTKLQEEYNTAISNKIPINKEWLENTIEELQGKKKENFEILTNYFDYYINNLPTKETKHGKVGVSSSTIKKYITVRHKIEAFEKYTNKKYLVKDVNLYFRNTFNQYLLKKEKLSKNYTGRLIKVLKTVCNNAKINGIETHKQIDAIKGYSEKAEKIYLNFKELKQIEETTFSRDALENAKDWLIIGCYIGQRVSDLLTLTSKNITTNNNLDIIELTQKKTGKPVVIPIYPKVQEILNKRNGKFPRKISTTKFNQYIKEIAKLSGIDEEVKGAKIIIKKINGVNVRRKKQGIYKKWELVTSHICRRSFATNFYSDIPTSLLISVTGHSSEKQFLVYIGKTEVDNAHQLATYWTQFVKSEEQKERLTISKKAI